MDTKSTKKQPADEQDRWADANKKLKSVTDYETRRGVVYKKGGTYWYVATPFLSSLEHPAKLFSFQLQKLELVEFHKCESDGDDDMSAIFKVVEVHNFGQHDFLDDYHEVGDTEYMTIDPSDDYDVREDDGDPDDFHAPRFWSSRYPEYLYSPEPTSCRAFDKAYRRLVVDAGILMKSGMFSDEDCFAVCTQRMNIMYNYAHQSNLDLHYEPSSNSIYNALFYHSIQVKKHRKACEDEPRELQLLDILFGGDIFHQHWSLDHGYVKMGREARKLREEGYFEEDGVDLRPLLRKIDKKAKAKAHPKRDAKGKFKKSR